MYGVWGGGEEKKVNQFTGRFSAFTSSTDINTIHLRLYIDLGSPHPLSRFFFTWHDFTFAALLPSQTCYCIRFLLLSKLESKFRTGHFAKGKCLQSDIKILFLSFGTNFFHLITIYINSISFTVCNILLLTLTAGT